MKDPETEHYTLGWPGKQRAYEAATSPFKGVVTEVPDRSWGVPDGPHVLIEGDNLDALKWLSESYRGKIKCIYIDPPYNTGETFVYADKFAQSIQSYRNDSATHTPDDGGRFHAQWLSLLYSRLLLAKPLLTNEGVICISIGEEEYPNLRRLCDEVFGEAHFRNAFIVRRHDKNLNRQFMSGGLRSFNVGFEYIVCYAASDAFRFVPVMRPHPDDEQSKRKNRSTQGYWKGFWNAADRPTMRYDIQGFTPTTGQWKWSPERGLRAAANYADFQQLQAADPSLTLEAHWEANARQLEFIRRQPTGKGMNQGVEHWIPPAAEGVLRSSNWTDLFASKDCPELGGIFDFPKNVTMIQTLLECCGVQDGDCVLDFFAGSGTTGHAILDMNDSDGADRRCILVQCPEPILPKSESAKKAIALGLQTVSDITITRLKRVSDRIQHKTAQPAPGFRILSIDHA